MQRTAPSTPPRRQENYEGSPALMMASRIRAEQGPEKAAQYLSAMEPFLAPGERTHIAYTLGLPIPQPVQQNYAQQSEVCLICRIYRTWAVWAASEILAA